MRDKAQFKALRPVRIERNYLRYSEGSALIEMGNTKVIVAATVQDKVPAFLKGTGEGWVSAEYALMPRSTPERNIREGRGGKIDSRGIEISRTIGRALRGAIDLSLLGEYTILLDCDVLQADGGTRTAAITGGFCALHDATRFMLDRHLIDRDPMGEFVAAVSVGVIGSDFILDLSYDEDARAKVDLNVVMTESGAFLEVQGTGEKSAFTAEELNSMLDLAWKGIQGLFGVQRETLGLTKP
jgi:ribonuclease PH